MTPYVKVHLSCFAIRNYFCCEICLLPKASSRNTKFRRNVNSSHRILAFFMVDVHIQYKVYLAKKRRSGIYKNRSVIAMLRYTRFKASAASRFEKINCTLIRGSVLHYVYCITVHTVSARHCSNTYILLEVCRLYFSQFAQSWALYILSDKLTIIR